MADHSQGESALVHFNERLTNSAAFGTLFREGMDLVEETAAYLDGAGRTEAKALDRTVSPHARDATFAVDGPRVRLVPAQPGVGLDVARSSAALLAAAERPTNRVARLAVGTVRVRRPMSSGSDPRMRIGCSDASQASKRAVAALTVTPWSLRPLP